MRAYKEYLKVIEDCGWKVNVMDSEIEIETWSPAGEDLVEYLRKDIDIYEQVSVIAENFDVDEHAEMWIEFRGTRGVPSSISELVKDAEAIEDMYSILAAELLKKKQEIERRRRKAV